MAERTTVIGRLGREPLKKSTSKGEVTEFSLAQSSRTLGPDGRWSDGPTTWYEVSAWDRLAANAAQSLHKGQPVLVHGVVFTREWTGRDGQVRSELRITAAAIGHDLNSGTASFAKSVPAAAQSAADEPRAAGTPAQEPGWGVPAVAEPAPAGASGGWGSAADSADDVPF